MFLKVMGPLKANADSISVHICNFDLFNFNTVLSDKDVLYPIIFIGIMNYQ
jgi:hypothetical protein